MVDPGELCRPLPIVLALICLGLIALLMIPSWPVARVVVSTVPRATLLAADGSVLASPAVLSVPPGGLELRISAPGYHTLDTLIAPKAGQVLLSLRYTFPARIRSRPAGVEVLVDGRRAGATPANLLLPGPGTVALELRDTVTGISLVDTLNLLANRPCSLAYEMPVPAMGGRMIHVPAMTHYLAADSGGPAAVPLGAFYISRREVSVEEICGFLNDVDSVLARDTTCRQGYTLLADSLFPADWDPGFRADTVRRLYHPRKGMEHHPAAGISMEGAAAYCRWLEESLLDSYPNIRVGLPTTRHWEAAARAGRMYRYPWGAERPSGSSANISDASEPLLTRCPNIDDGHPGLAPAGRYPPNPWGLWDMSGNLAELCLADDGTVYAFGGSWLSDRTQCRCDSHMAVEADQGYPFVGFRIMAWFEGDSSRGGGGI